MKFKDVGVCRAITRIETDSFINGRTESIKRHMVASVDLLLEKLSDMDHPEILYFKIEVSDKPIN